MSVDNDPPARWDGRCIATWTNGNRCESGAGHDGDHYGGGFSWPRVADFFARARASGHDALGISNDPEACEILTRLADGTDSKRYQPMSGDLCELKQGGPPWVYGSRLVTIKAEARGHGVEDQWWVRAPGEVADWCVETDDLELVRRG